MRTLGKGIGGGYPLAALLTKERLNLFEPGDQGGTYTGQPLAMAVGKAVLEELLQRDPHLGRVLNNARFLLLPWVQVKNLASRVLALAAAQVVEDFAARYGERPVLLETFVETPRFRATCYRAANWRYLGETQGRGKCDVAHRAALPRKGVYVYPLTTDFRRALGVAA